MMIPPRINKIHLVDKKHRDVAEMLLGHVLHEARPLRMLTLEQIDFIRDRLAFAIAKEGLLP